MTRCLMVSFSITILGLFAGCAYDHGEVPRGISLAGAPSNVNATASEPKDEANGEPDSAPASLKVVMKNGWDVPGLNAGTAGGPCETANTEGVASRCTVIKPHGKVIAEVSRYVLGKDGILYLFPDKWVVNQIKQYDVAGRKYCYVVDATLLKADSSGNAMSRYSADSKLFFYDEDGNGSFESFEHGWGRTIKSEIPVPPQWARGKD